MKPKSKMTQRDRGIYTQHPGLHITKIKVNAKAKCRAKRNDMKIILRRMFANRLLKGDFLTTATAAANSQRDRFPHFEHNLMTFSCE